MKKILLVLCLVLFFIPSTYSKSSNKDAVEAYNLGIDAYQEGDIEGSVANFKKATQLDQNFYEAFYNLAQVLNSIGKRDEAIDAYTRAITLEPASYDCVYDLGEALYKRGYLMKSVSYLNKIPPTSKNYEEAQKLLKIVKERQVIVAAEIEAKKQAQLEAQKKNQEGFSLSEETKKEEPKENERSNKTVIKKEDKANYINTYTNIKSPSGVAIDSVGNIYIASYSDNIVYKIDSTGKKTEFVSSSILEGPIGLCFDKDDNLYIANYTKGNILKVTPQGAPYLFVKIEKPYYISASKNYLYITEQKNNTIVKYAL